LPDHYATVTLDAERAARVLKLGLLRELAPRASVIAVLLNPITPDAN
jgi:hypothetical protein